MSQAALCGAVDGYGYKSGEEHAYRHAALEMGKRILEKQYPAAQPTTGGK